jgi:hypothetical protein
MITIKKGKLSLTLPNEYIASSQETTDGMYVKFSDGSEIFLRNIAVGLNQIKSAAMILFNSKASNIVIDLNNSTNPVSLS